MRSDSFYSKERASAAAAAFKSLYNGPVDGAVVLGSGMSTLLSEFKKEAEIPFSSIPGYPLSKVAGHSNQYIIIDINGKKILVSLGRVHMYEGLSAGDATLGIAMMGEIGVKKLMLTNAAGAINKTFSVGDIIAITDHINLQGLSPLTGIPDSSKFLDLSQAYNQVMRVKVQSNFKLKEGVYAGLMGPNYETPAEIRYLRTIGADIVGMSTVQEAIMAAYYKMVCTGFSLITNMACGILEEPLCHEEVLAASKKAEKNLIDILIYWAAI